MPPVVSGGIGNDYALLVCQQILIPACLDEVAAELVVEYLLGLIGLERCYDLLVGLQLVRILEVRAAIRFQYSSMSSWSSL